LIPSYFAKHFSTARSTDLPNGRIDESYRDRRASAAAAAALARVHANRRR
jgi:hypothetical protein